MDFYGETPGCACLKTHEGRLPRRDFDLDVVAMQMHRGGHFRSPTQLDGISALDADQFWPVDELSTVDRQFENMLPCCLGPGRWRNPSEAQT